MRLLSGEAIWCSEELTWALKWKASLILFELWHELFDLSFFKAELFFEHFKGLQTFKVILLGGRSRRSFMLGDRLGFTASSRFEICSNFGVMCHHFIEEACFDDERKVVKLLFVTRWVRALQLCKCGCNLSITEKQRCFPLWLCDCNYCIEALSELLNVLLGRVQVLRCLGGDQIARLQLLREDGWTPVDVVNFFLHDLFAVGIRVGFDVHEKRDLRSLAAWTHCLHLSWLCEDDLPDKNEDKDSFGD